MFQLTKVEWNSLRSQFVTSKGRGGTRYTPYAFTEQGLAMLSGVLSSKKAIEVNILIMRAFVYLRKYSLSHKELTEKIKQLENQYNAKFKDIYEALNFLLQKDSNQSDFDNREKSDFNTSMQAMFVTCNFFYLI